MIGRRRAAGHHDADIAGLLVVRQPELGERRDVRQRWRALPAGDGERRDLVALQQPERGGDVGAKKIDLAARYRQHRRRDAAIGHVQQRDPGLAPEQLHAEVVCAALADRSIAQRLVVPRLGERQQVLERADAERPLHQQHVRRRREIGHRREVVQRVVGQALEQARIGRDAGVGIEQRVAVGRGLGDRVGADGVAGARAVLDDHRHVPFVVEALRQRAGHGVDAAAGVERHHDLDGAVGKFGVGQRGATSSAASKRPADRSGGFGFFVFHGRTIGHLFSRNRSARLLRQYGKDIAWHATSAWRSSAPASADLRRRARCASTASM